MVCFLFTIVSCFIVYILLCSVIKSNFIYILYYKIPEILVATIRTLMHRFSSLLLDFYLKCIWIAVSAMQKIDEPLNFDKVPMTKVSERARISFLWNQKWLDNLRLFCQTNMCSPGVFWCLWNIFSAVCSVNTWGKLAST